MGVTHISLTSVTVEGMKKTIKTTILTTVLVALTASVAHAGPKDFGVQPKWPLPEAAQKAKAKAAKPDIPAPVNGAIEGVSLDTLNTIAACESGGDPAAVNAAGYYGKYQFDTQTWASVGGSGNPAEASEAEQDYRAAILYSRAGSSPWPVCGV